MNRTLRITIFLVMGFHLLGALSIAQQSPVAVSAVVARLRTEGSAQRQSHSLAGLAESVAAQRASVERQKQSMRSFAQVFRPLSPGSAAGFAAPQCDALPPGDVDTLVDNAARQTSLAPALIRSVMSQESAFRPCAVSSKGAIGLMQLLPSTASGLGVKDIFDPEANVVGGARLLRQLSERYKGDLALTLSAYNAGSARVDSTMSIPEIAETADYVRRILSMLLPSAQLDSAANKKADSDVDNQEDERESASETSLLLTGADGGE